MSKHASEARDPLIDEVRETRQRLVREHGGLKGWFKHLQDRPRRHPGKIRPRPRHMGR